MANEILVTNNSLVDSIKKNIYDLRGRKVMLDRDLASLYGVETRVLNQAVKRNIDRFPADFMFQLTEIEWGLIAKDSNMSSQVVMTSPQKRPKTAIPFAFTEYGAVMLASVLKSPSAIQMSVFVTKAFIAMRQTISALLSMDFKVEQLSHKVDQLNAYIEEILHDQNDINQMQERTNNEIAIQIEVINDVLDELRNVQFHPRVPIGFKKDK